MAAERASETLIADMLSPVAFAEPCAAHERVLRIVAGSLPAPPLRDFLAHLAAALSTAAGPDRVLVSLERFLASSSGDRLGYLARHPRAIEILVSLFAGSQFLTEILLRNPEYLAQLVQYRSLSQPKSLATYCAEARSCIRPPGEDAPPAVLRAQWVADLDAVRRYQRSELLRIGACDLLDLYDLPVVTQQLSHLAEALVRACLSLASHHVGIPARGFSVVAMGKLGGSELNYSSDIDLLFLAATDPTDYVRLGERLIEALTHVTPEGFLYRVDMRLRPWGQVGALVSSVDGYLSYLEQHARLWEKQALLKARHIAGDACVADGFLARIEPLVFGGEPHAVRADVFAMKQRTEQLLRERGRAWGEVKLGEGSIRDVEFVAQYLQLAHGAAHPEVRSRNTVDALVRLTAHGLLDVDECRVLRDGYVLLRTIEHYLQMMHYRQTHALPEDAGALSQLARRLGFAGSRAGAALLARYEQYRGAIRDIYLSHLGSDDMATIGKPSAAGTGLEVGQHVARMDPSYSEAFADGEIQLHATLAAQLDADHLVEVHAIPLERGRWKVTVVGYDFPGELSLICGLLFAHGLSIEDGDVFTYEPVEAPPLADQARPSADRRRKIVDVFTVRPEAGPVSQGTWVRYNAELGELLELMQAGQQTEAHGKLVRGVAAALRDIAAPSATLYPVEIEVDNDTSEAYTLLRIDAPDTIGFLYEFTNALALSRIYIARVVVASVGGRAHDVLYVTDARGHKITSARGQRELRAATVLIKHFTHLLPIVPNPESALIHFRQFIGELFRRSDWPDELTSLERPEVLNALARLLGVSDFLWNDFLRMQYANLFPVVRDVDALQTAKWREQLQTDLQAALLPVHAGPQARDDSAPWREVLNDFKDREMFRIDMRHILGHTQEFWDFAGELTDLVEVVVNAAYHLCHEDLRAQYGAPCLEDGSISEMSVCALGKCGGRELGFASDIELMFVYAGNGSTTGPKVITTAEFYEMLVRDFVRAIRARREGIFEIDLQLRPYGKSGSMAVSLESFRRYYTPDGPAWAYERQALVKMRPIAGSVELGHRVVALRDAFAYDGQPFDVTAMRAMRERQIRHLVTGGTFNAKFSPGGLVDVEYLVEGLQITYGHADPGLRQTNIRQAMAALADAGILAAEDYARLRRAHTFLRWLIDGLRMVRGNARDLTVPPPDSEAFAFLSRRLRYARVEDLRSDMAHHTTSVQELNQRLLGA
ncbi:MAG: glutamine synthetase adenylyltransferase [Anaerolineae bacterium]|nr:glutamine synthetase adenylyltransferase [Anaerolineae bacterium]